MKNIHNPSITVFLPPKEKAAGAADPIEQLDARADFQIMIYPGPLGIPEVVPTNAPLAFFLAATDDQQPARTIAGLSPKYRASKTPIEAHLFSHGGHAFNMGTRSRPGILKNWPRRVADWMTDNNILDPAQPRPARSDRTQTKVRLARNQKRIRLSPLL